MKLSVLWLHMQAQIFLYEVIGIVAAYAGTIPITSYNDNLCALAGQIKDLIRVLSTCTVQLRRFWIPCCAHTNKILQKLRTLQSTLNRPALKKQNMNLRYSYTAGTLVVQSEVSVISGPAEWFLEAQQKVTLRITGLMWIQNPK